MDVTKIQYPYSLSVAQIERYLVTKKSTGLSQQEVDERQKEFGLNVLPQEKVGTVRWKIFLSQWKSPLLYLLLFASAISFLLGEHLDAAVVLFTAVANAVVGFFQENKANQALNELAQYAPHYTQVRRHGMILEVLNQEIVPGDIIILREGNKVPADARLFDTQDFFVSEAALTGESTSVEKHTRALNKSTTLADRKNMVFAGTQVARGKAYAMVTATGLHTELGQIATMVKETKEIRTPLQEQVIRIGRYVTILVILAAALIFTIGLLQSRGLSEVFLIAVAVGVAAIPEGLVVSITVILTVGMRRILANQALARKLVATETLGSVSVMCVDKTGTITQGRMRVVEELLAPAIFGDATTIKHQALLSSAAALCTEAEIIRSNTSPELGYSGEPTEVALLQHAVKYKLHKDTLEKKQPRLATVGFEHSRMYMATLHRTRASNMVYVKGAPEKVLELCGSRIIGTRTKALTASAREDILLHEEHMTRRGLRVLAIAYAKVPKTTKTLTPKNMPKLTFVGFVGLKDPVRPHVEEVVAKAKRAGVRTVMITGDHILTAQSIAKSVGLLGKNMQALTGAQVDDMTKAQLKKAVRSAAVFARVEPKHKIRIVQALQSNGEVVAMTGDGVNDAPAIKAADIGIAVGSGTDVARGVADLVLLDDDVSTIVAAIEQGRIIFQNIRKVVLYLFSNMFTEVILITGSLLLFLPLPITAVQILWINFVTDAFPNIALAFDPGDPQAMQRPPRKRKTPIIDREMKFIIFLISVVADAILFLFFFSIQNTNLSLEFIQTMMFLTVGMGTIMYIYSVRSLRVPVWRTNPFANRTLLLAQAFGVLALVATVYVPVLQQFLGTVAIGPVDWLIVLMVALVKLALIELVKWAFTFWRKRNHSTAIA